MKEKVLWKLYYEWPLVISPTLPKQEEPFQVVTNALQIGVCCSHLEPQQVSDVLAK